MQGFQWLCSNQGKTQSSSTDMAFLEKKRQSDAMASFVGGGVVSISTSPKEPRASFF